MPRLLFFGQLRDRAGDLHERVVAGDARTVADVLDWIATQDADLAAALKVRGVRVAVDQSFATLEAPVSAQSELAFMSPLSGG